MRQAIRSELASRRAVVAGIVAASLLVAAWVPGAPLAPTTLAHSHDAAGHYAGHGARHDTSAAFVVTPSSETPYALTDTPAASLRVGLNALLAEHVYLAARATGAALNGQQAAFEAAAASLDANSVDLSKTIGAAYGPDAEAAFLPLWRAHIGMVVDYTVGTATNDQAKQDRAVADLVGYTQDFGAFLNGANEHLPKEVVAALVKDHVLSLKDVIDAQHARDQARVYSALRTAMGHMAMIADPLAAATATKFPAQLGGDAMTPAATYRVALNTLLREHVFLAASAALGGLSGNQAQFAAAAGELDSNSVAIAKRIGMAYGAEAEAAFLPLWRSHIGMVVDYTVGTATNDQAKQDKAVADLLGYTQDFAAFLGGANEYLPKEVVAGLVKDHVLTLKDVIDAQAAGTPAAHFTALRAAAGHMAMIADPLAEATVAKFPARFMAGQATTRQMAAQVEPPVDTSAEVRQFAFRPAALQVPAGTTVTWTNQDAVQHSVTHGSAGVPEGTFDSGLFGQGDVFSFTFADPGEYRYYCLRHPSMQGVVSVE